MGYFDEKSKPIIVKNDANITICVSEQELKNERTAFPEKGATAFVASDVEQTSSLKRELGSHASSIPTVLVADCKSEETSSRGNELSNEWQDGTHTITKRMWLVEWLILLCSTLFMVALTCILGVFNGRVIPTLYGGININTIVSLLATGMHIALGMLFLTIFGALRFIWYCEARSLEDLDLFGAAGQPSLDTIQLLGKALRNKSVPLMLGLLASLSSLGIGPSLQQSISTRNIFVSFSEYAIVPTLQAEPWCYVLWDMAGEQLKSSDKSLLFLEPRQLDLGTKVSLWLGLQGNGVSLVPNCGQQRCTWPSSRSLAICASCQDVTHLLKQSCRECPFAMPNGLELHVNSVLNSSAILPLSAYGPTKGTLANITFIRRSDMTGENPSATECSIHWCVQTDFGSFNLGNVSQTITHVYQNDTLSESRIQFLKLNNVSYRGSNYYDPADVELASEDGVSAAAFSVTDYGSNQFQRFFRDTFTSNITAEKVNIWSNINVYPLWRGGTSACLTLDFPDFVMCYLYQNDGREQETLSNMTASVSAYLRSRSTTVIGGEAGNEVTVLDARWDWTILPAIVHILALSLIIVMMGLSKEISNMHIRNSNAALVVAGLPDEDRQYFGQDLSGHEFSRSLRQGKVCLRSTQHGWRFKLVAGRQRVDGQRFEQTAPAVGYA